MSRGRLVAVVGPSGVGKDSVIAGLASACPSIHVVRRVITRAPELGREAYDAVSPQDFAAMAHQNRFALHWEAHGLHYGIPNTVQATLERGKDCLANLSRSVLAEAAQRFDPLVVLHITAQPHVLARRLRARNREDEAAIVGRLAQAGKPLAPGLTVVNLPNDGALADTVTLAVAALGLAPQPSTAELSQP